MNKLLAILAVLLLPLSGFAQDEESVNLDMYIWQMSAQCPCDVGDEWCVTSIIAVADTVTLEIEVPATLKGFLSMLTENSDNVKRLWTSQVIQFGDSWKQLVDLVASEKRWLQLFLTPSGSKQSDVVVISPEKLGTILVNN